MSAPRSSRWVLGAASVLLALHFALAVTSKLRESTTSDELVHVTGGYSYWAFNDYRLQPENGNLPQRWEALPAWLSGARFPSLDQVYWRVSDAWVMGHEFFYESGQDHFPLLMRARAMNAVLSVALGALIFAWSRRLFGNRGALVSLAFFAFCPTFLAHGALATSDACVSLLMLASMGAWWRHLNTPGLGPFAASAALFGLACVAKFSAVLLVPMMLLCAAAYWAVRRGEAWVIILSFLGHAAAALGVIWAFYGFRYSAFSPAVPAAQQFIQAWPEMYARTGAAGSLIHWLANHHALPEAFLYGAAYVVETSRARGAFLNGDYSIEGWHSFFLWAFALKTTLPFMAASAAGTWLVARRALSRGPGLRDLAEAAFPFVPLAALFLVYWAFSIVSHLNIGQRHIMPVYPVLFILSGSLGTWLVRPLRAGAATVALLIGWHASESLAVFPHYLAYFNELAGGPAGGYRHLVDSSLDWGQDLPGLKAWLDVHRRPGEDVYLSYMGTAEPTYYHMGAKRLAYLNLGAPEEPYVDLGPGLYCVSASMLQQVYGTVRGPWTLQLEREYGFLRSFETGFRAYAVDPSLRPRLEAALPPEKWRAARDRFMSLRFARLCYYLRVRKPDAVIGYSLFVYRLGADEVFGSTEGSLRDWAALISRSGVSEKTP